MQNWIGGVVFGVRASCIAVQLDIVVINFTGIRRINFGKIFTWNPQSMHILARPTLVQVVSGCNQCKTSEQHTWLFAIEICADVASLHKIEMRNEPR